MRSRIYAGRSGARPEAGEESNVVIGNRFGGSPSHMRGNSLLPGKILIGTDGGGCKVRCV